ncbi:MAG: PQQ-like beta-propeller repeat protein [Armatimonadaceae bacterium]
MQIVMKRPVQTVLTSVSVAAVSLFLASAGWAQDWNQWRGPRRDARIEAGTGSVNLAAKPVQKWKLTVGEGHSSPIVAGNRVYLFARQEENEVLHCLDRASGKSLWQGSYPAPYEMNPAARGHGKGPKSTPVYTEGRVYTLGISGILTCWNAETGKVEWRKEFGSEYPQTAPDFGTAMSPVVENGVLFAHVGGKNNGALTAFDARTGTVRWKWTGDGPGYSSPVLVTLDGVRQVVTQTQNQCVGVDAATGKLLWSLPFKTPYEQNSVTPVVAENTVIFGGLRQPTFACRVQRSGDSWNAERVWEAEELTMYMSSPVLDGNRLYGMSDKRRGLLFVLDAQTGKTLWTGEGRMGDNASVWNLGGSIVALTTGAELLVYRKDGNTLTETAKHTLAESAVWASPAFVGNQLLVKDFDSLALWEWTGAEN